VKRVDSETKGRDQRANIHIGVGKWEKKWLFIRNRGAQPWVLVVSIPER
jgi:hypothetical protein